jgi:hypothetical protein
MMWQAVHFIVLSAVWWFADVYDLRKTEALFITGVIFFIPSFPKTTVVLLIAIVTIASGLLDQVTIVDAVVCLLGFTIALVAGAAPIASVMIGVVLLHTHTPIHTFIHHHL